MKQAPAIALLFLIVLIFSAATVADRKPAILIFSKTNGYHHACIPVGIAAIRKLGEENNFAVDTTTDSLKFTPKILKKYAAIVFMCPTGEVLGTEQQEAFKKYIQGGGGFAGIHSATDCEYNFPWYGQLVGAYFKSHPKQQEAKLIVVNKNHPSTESLPDSWVRRDEWYNFRDLAPGLSILIKIDESSYTGGENGSNHPMAWYHSFEGGRAFYTGLGHTDESYSDPIFLKHLLGGIEWAMKKP
ncbi:MAG: ThuA domain-containing protein [Bacteroidota bacterium]|nr:ThuA domain-containing protein [Bacteroidota bacterium]